MIDGTDRATDRWGMPRWVLRLVFMITGIVIALFVAFHVLQRLRGLLVLLLISLFLSVALEPGVNYLSRRRGWRRGLATGAMFLGLVLTAGLFVGLMVPLIVDQVSLLVTRAPGYIDQIEKFLRDFGVEFSGDNLDEAITQANSLPYAFQASIFTRDLDTALRASSRLDASAVMVNDHTAFRVDWMPFAGLRESGLAVGGIPYTFHDMQIEKLTVVRSSELR